MDINPITDKIIGAAIKVHSVLGPGLLESMYEKCMALELTKTQLHFECQAPLHVIYDGIKVGHGYYVDILVEQSVVVEIKTVDRFHPIHTAQVLSYLKAAVINLPESAKLPIGNSRDHRTISIRSMTSSCATT